MTAAGVVAIEAAREQVARFFTVAEIPVIAVGVDRVVDACAADAEVVGAIHIVIALAVACATRRRWGRGCTATEFVGADVICRTARTRGTVNVDVEIQTVPTCESAVDRMR